jgi:hypothetical protein
MTRPAPLREALDRRVLVPKNQHQETNSINSNVFGRMGLSRYHGVAEGLHTSQRIPTKSKGRRMARTRLRLMILTFGGLLAAAGLNVATAGPAAAIPGLGNVTVATVVDSSVFKSAIAPCPAGQRIIGGGARVTLATGEVSITRMAPTASADGYEAQAYEDFDGFAGNWGLIITAVCAPTPPGYTIVTAASPMASPATASVTATCPAGRQVLGTGGSVFPGRGVVLLTASIPSPAVGPTSVTVTGAEIAGGYGSTWNVQAWAICAAPVAGHTVVVTTGVANSASPKIQISACPAGLSVHGLGFQFGGGVGEIFLNMAFPNPAAPVGTSVPVIASEDQSGFAGNWAIRTFAICVP